MICRTVWGCLWIWRCSAKSECFAGELTGCKVKYDILCKQETQQNLFARHVLNAPSVWNALLKHINMAWIKFLTVWWWQPLFFFCKENEGGRGASLVDGLLGLLDGSASLYFPLPQGGTVTDSQWSTRAQTAAEIELQVCFYSFR